MVHYTQAYWPFLSSCYEVILEEMNMYVRVRARFRVRI